MYSDTHFHFSILREEDGWTRRLVLEKMAASGFTFALDIGTRADDLRPRQDLFAKTLLEMEGSGDEGNASAEACRNFIYFSAGIWPDAQAIKDRASSVQTLKENILAAQGAPGAFEKKLCALGECGLDHHWNPSGADGRSQDDFDQAALDGERELFLAQLALAKELDLPVVVHSRDAAAETLECIKESGWGGRAVIHCYSYGIEEARRFLDEGCMISFSGSITYAKKSKAEEMRALVAFVPQDRIFLETDAPYLAPVPLRGKANNPTFIEWTYAFAADARRTSAALLCETVERNARNFFALS